MSYFSIAAVHRGGPAADHGVAANGAQLAAVHRGGLAADHGVAANGAQTAARSTEGDRLSTTADHYRHHPAAAPGSGSAADHGRPPSAHTLPPGH